MPMSGDGLVAAHVWAGIVVAACALGILWVAVTGMADIAARGAGVVP